MPIQAQSLRDLHSFHLRIKAIRERLIAIPKQISSRQAILKAKHDALDAAKKQLRDEKLEQARKESLVQTFQSRNTELRVKLNATRKNDEYQGILKQIQENTTSVTKTEDSTVESMVKIDTAQKNVLALEADLAKYQSDTQTLIQQLEEQAVSQKVVLRELQNALVQAEAIIPEETREQYQRVLRQRGSDAMAEANEGSCSGCFTSFTTQLLNDLINSATLVFCKSCGRILYLPEESEDVVSTPVKKKGRSAKS